MYLPLDIGDFSDFSCSKDHNIRMGEIVFGNGDLPPGFFSFPSAYTGRSASIVASGTAIKRPWGVYRDPQNPNATITGPSAWLDYELELACVIGKPVPFGQRCSIDEAEEHIFGFVLLNDWSGQSEHTSSLFSSLSGFTVLRFFDLRVVLQV